MTVIENFKRWFDHTSWRILKCQQLLSRELWDDFSPNFRILELYCLLGLKISCNRALPLILSFDAALFLAQAESRLYFWESISGLKFKFGTRPFNKVEAHPSSKSNCKNYHETSLALLWYTPTYDLHSWPEQWSDIRRLFNMYHYPVNRENLVYIFTLILRKETLAWLWWKKRYRISNEWTALIFYLKEQKINTITCNFYSKTLSFQLRYMMHN